MPEVSEIAAKSLIVLETHSWNRESADEKLDLVLAYVLGDVTEAERSEFEARLASGDAALTLAYEAALESFSSLPRALTSAVPPPFVKERVLNRVRTEEAFGVVFSEDYEIAQQPAQLPLLTRILSLVPGYGSFTLASLLPSPAVARRSLGFAFLVLGGIFASAYAIDKVASVMTSARMESDHFADQVRAYRTKQAKTASFSAVMATPVGQQSATLETANATAPETKATLSVAAPRANEVATSAATKAANIPPVRVGSDRLQTNFSSVDAQMYFVTSPITLRYELSPLNAGSNGFARVSWDNAHSDAFFTVSGLQATQPGTHYVLWYLNEDGSKRRLMTFEAQSEAIQFFFLDDAPDVHVRGALITLETSSREHGQASSTSILKATNITHKR